MHLGEMKVRATKVLCEAQGWYELNSSEKINGYQIYQILKLNMVERWESPHTTSSILYSQQGIECNASVDHTKIYNYNLANALLLQRK